MGAKQIPQLSADLLSFNSDRMVKQKLVEEALFKKDSILAEIAKDEYLENIPRVKVEKLLEDVMRIAPLITTDNPSIVTSVIRGAALTGADSIDVATANQLALLEKNYVGR
jgi:hypothetical protein